MTPEQVLAAWSLPGHDLIAAARATADGAPELDDEQIARLRTVLAEPAAAPATAA